MYTSRGLEELAVLKDQYNSKNRQAQLFFNRKPAPTKANLEALNRNYADLSAAFQTVQGTLNLNTYDRDLFFGHAPGSHNEAFFMIAKYVDDAR